MKTPPRLTSLLWLLLLSTLMGCSSKHDASTISADYASPSAEMAQEAGDTRAQNGPQRAEDNPAIPERKVIREGTLNFETNDARKTHAQITQMVADLGGYIGEDNAQSYSDQTSYMITLRVPAEKFDLLLSGVLSSAAKIDSKNIQALDVTEEYIDIEARVKTKKELEARYKELLRQANSVNEVMSVEREISSVRTEIESVEGRLRYLNSKIAYSTLKVNFYERGPVSKVSFRFFSKVVKGIESGWHGLLWTLVGLVNIWPLLLFVGIAIWGLRKAGKKRQAKKGV